MIFDEFCHIGMGDTGEGIIRNALAKHVINSGMIKPINTTAHMSLKEARKYSDAPAFTSIRNPWDYYISCWIHRLKNHKYFCGFKDWFFKEYHSMYDNFMYFTDNNKIPFEHIIRFEHVEEDFSRILPEICDLFTTEQVLSWFPEAYTQWSKRLWSENIEQWMRNELYNEKIKEIVLERDKWIFDTWGYTFDQHYITHRGHLG